MVASNTRFDKPLNEEERARVKEAREILVSTSFAWESTKHWSYCG